MVCGQLYDNLCFMRKCSIFAVQNKTITFKDGLKLCQYSL